MDLPFSHLLRCRLPSFPFLSSSLRLRLSRVGVTFREGNAPGGTSRRTPLEIRLGSSSSEIASGLPVPRAEGETFSDSSAAAVHASMSMGVEFRDACAGRRGSVVERGGVVGAGRRGSVVVGALGSRFGGGGTAL